MASNIDDDVLEPSTPPRESRSNGSTSYSLKRPSPAKVDHLRDSIPLPDAPPVWYDKPIVIALIPALGNFLTRGEHFRDFLLFALTLYYLHQLIRVPWHLYQQTRAQIDPHGVPHLSEEEQQLDPKIRQELLRLRKSARAELRLAQLFFLGMSVLSPFLGAFLLNYASSVVTGNHHNSWFSTSVFVLATGVRPWRHLVDLLTARTYELQYLSHCPPPLHLAAVQHLKSRITSLELELESSRKAAAECETMFLTFREAADVEFEKLETAFKRHVQENAASRDADRARIVFLENSMADTLEDMRALKQAITSTNRYVTLKTSSYSAFRRTQSHLTTVPEEQGGGMQDRSGNGTVSQSNRLQSLIHPFLLPLLLIRQGLQALF